MSMHYFSRLGGTGTDFAKSVTGHVMPNLCFWIQCGFQKKRDETRYIELTFLHLVGFAGHIVHCIASTHYFSCSGHTGTDSTKRASGHLTPNLCFCI
jgi:hypothetical protein